MTRIAIRNTPQQRIAVSRQQQSIGFGCMPTLVIGGSGGAELVELRNKYSARFERNDDGDSTFSVVMPIVKGVEEQVGEVKAKETEEYKLMKKTFSARFVKNNDGDNTYSMILPVVSEIMKNEDGTVTIKL